MLVQDHDTRALQVYLGHRNIQHTVLYTKHGSLMSFSLTVSPVKNADGKIIGASKIARDITEQKRAQDQITTLAREAEHRSKNLLANIQAAVTLFQSDTSEGLKQAIEGRIQALANVHSLFVDCARLRFWAAPSAARIERD